MKQLIDLILNLVIKFINERKTDPVETLGKDILGVISGNVALIIPVLPFIIRADLVKEMKDSVGLTKAVVDRVNALSKTTSLTPNQLGLVRDVTLSAVYAFAAAVPEERN